MTIPRLAVYRPVTTLMILVSILVIGGFALVRLPLAYLPTLDFPAIGISVPYPNSNPTQIEKEITKPVEEVLSTLSGVKTLRSTSTADSADFNLEFAWGSSLDIVRMRVSEKMEQRKGSLPEDIGDIQIFSFNTNDIPVIQARISAEGVDLSSNYELIASRVLNRIRRVAGVARVDINGVRPREIDIDLILDRVKQHDVDVGAVIALLQGASANLVLGRVSHDGVRYTARALGAFSTVDEIRNLRVNAQGLRLSDIARVRYEEPPIAFGRHLDGHYAVAVEVYKKSTA
ncbi:MAG: efflux RND transporter permease subunit, partial [Acidobacteriota bacterium]